MKKIPFLTVFLLLILLFSACGAATPPVAGSSSSQTAVTPSGPEATPPLHIPELTVELPRALDTTSALAAMESLPAAMAAHNVIIDSVSVSFGPAYSATADALAQGYVQLAFLPAEDFLDLGCTDLLLADAYPTDDGSLAPGVTTLICTGPSDYGTRLADIAATRSTPLTWAELDHARWGVLSSDSLEGHRLLRLWLEDNYQDNGIVDLSRVTVYDSWDSLLHAAATEEIDLFPMPSVREDSVAARWNSDFSRSGSFRDEVRTVGISASVCTWVAAIAPDDTAVHDPRFPQALSAVINDLFSDPAAQKAAIGAEFYAPADSADLNPLRRLLLGD